jgi:phosphoribosylformylglycinamidine cyclo-ligase
VLPRIRGLAHITGGGLTDNMPRILPDGLGARFDRSSWRVPALFSLIQERGGVSAEDMFHTFNMGIGIVAVVAPDEADAIMQQVPDAWAVGEIVKQADQRRVIIE